jgi:teichuronic acid biosynthesis glycosyltransferase TuaC
MDDFKVILVSANYPNYYINLWSPWNRLANIAISQLDSVKVEVVAPLPYSVPIKYFPYYQLSKIPLIEKSVEGIIHRPRFFYLLPKKYFYGISGDSYRKFVSKYIINNLDKPNLIHAHQAYPDGYGIIEVCKKWSIPSVIEIHSTDTINTWSSNSGLRKRFMNTLNFADKIICISESLVSNMETLGIENEKLEFISLGVDINKFKPRDKQALREEFGISERVIILFVGLMIKRKGIDYLLSAISKLPEYADFRVIIVGNGPEQSNLYNLSRKLGVDHKVTFMGELKGKPLLKLYSLADIFVLPSMAEGRPIAIYEAMASECAIIASNVDGIPEQIKENYNGILVEPKDSDSLSNQIKFLIENEILIKKMGKNSRKRIIEKGWTWDGYAKKIFKVYDKIIG